MPARRRLVLAALAIVVLAAASTGLVLGLSGSGGGGGGLSGAAERAAAQRARMIAAELARQARVAGAATAAVSIGYPTGDGQPAPAWSGSAFAKPLPRHVVFGFAPYYSLGQLTPADFADATTIAYDGVQLTPSGLLDERPSDLGWQDLNSAAFSSLIGQAHRAGDQLLLTVFADSAKVINGLTSHPATTGARLARQLTPILADDRLDGVDVDVEGSGSADRGGFVRFMRSFTSTLRSTAPSAVIVLDTYPGSAGDPRSFFDVKALAPLVDSMFVMAYDMYQGGVASPNAPLVSPTLGLSDIGSLLQYTKVAPPQKLILGVPFYGYDFTTASDAPGATTVTRYPEAVTWQSILAAGHPALWDPSSETPWYHFKLHGKWHETYFDDPASIALKTALAAELHLEGVGVWALGMEAGDTSMLDALLGGAPARKLPLTASAVVSWTGGSVARTGPGAAWPAVGSAGAAGGLRVG